MPKNKSASKGARTARLRSVILCDQLRTEATGKKLLIGCYDGGIAFHRKPSLFSGRLVGNFDLEPGPHRIKYRVRAPHVMGEGSIAPEDDHGEGGVVEFDAPFSTLVEESGEIIFEWCVDDGDWEEKFRWELEISEDATSLATAEADELRARFWGSNWTRVKKMLRARAKAQDTKSI